MDGTNQAKQRPKRRQARARKRPADEEEDGGGGARATAVPDLEDFSKEKAGAIRASLLRWYDDNKRDLPWRHSKQQVAEEEEERRAYAVWVSEVMLQQTRVSTVVDYYRRWMAKWPTLRHLATASQEEVNDVWAGLGYYRRARFLLEGAKSIVREGKFPRTADALRAVRGIGDYTAGAIASIAFDQVVPVVDGNVVRVISRLKAISANPKESATVKSFWKLAGQLVDPSRPGDFNQAVMELGATLCSKASPGCSGCPISNQCHALAISKRSETIKVTDYPTKVTKAKQRQDFAAVCVVQIAKDPDREDLEDSDKEPMFLIVKRPEEGLLAGLWEFPSVLVDEERTNAGARRKAMDKYLKKVFNLDVGGKCSVSLREEVGEYVHVFSHIRLHMYVEFLILTIEGGLNLMDFGEDQSKIKWRWVDESSIGSMGLTTGVRKVYNMIQDFKRQQPTQCPTKASGKKSRKTIS